MFKLMIVVNVYFHCVSVDMHRDKLEQLFHSLDIWHKSCKLTANLTKVIGVWLIF